MESRAALFTTEPQSVEVYRAGAWWAGELLGWRHAVDGSCQVWVRVPTAGVQEVAWMDLARLRLPERHPSPAAAPAASPAGSAAQPLPRASAAVRRKDPDVAQSAATATMQAVRDLPGVPVPRPGGRRRAPEGPETVVAQAPSAPRSSGRRRAPEVSDTAEVQEVAGATPNPAAGRHRAALPADVGRHRRADTGVLPVVGESAGAAPVDRPVPDLRTRPMRGRDTVPHGDRPRHDGSLSHI